MNIKDFFSAEHFQVSFSFIEALFLFSTSSMMAAAKSVKEINGFWLWT